MSKRGVIAIAGPHRHAGVHLEQLVVAVAPVVGELDLREALVARALEQAQPELAHARLRRRAEDGARAEVERPLAHLHARHGRERRAVCGRCRRTATRSASRESGTSSWTTVSKPRSLRALPLRDELVAVVRDQHLLAERAGEVLALDRLEQERRRAGRRRDPAPPASRSSPPRPCAAPRRRRARPPAAASPCAAAGGRRRGRRAAAARTAR